MDMATYHRIHQMAGERLTPFHNIYKPYILQTILFTIIILIYLAFLKNSMELKNTHLSTAKARCRDLSTTSSLSSNSVPCRLFYHAFHKKRNGKTQNLYYLR